MRDVKSNMIYGDMPPEIPRLFVSTLKAKKVPVMTRRLTPIIIAIVLLIAIACTAIATVIYRRSAPFEAAAAAKRLLNETYGIKPEWMRAFSETVIQDDGGWTVTYTPDNQMEQLGEYQVSLPFSGASSVSWTHGDADLSENATLGFASDTWGADQECDPSGA